MSATIFSAIEDLVFNGLVAAVALLERAEKALECHRYRDSSSILTVAASAATDAASATSSAFAQCFDCIRRLLRSLFVAKAADISTDGSDAAGMNDDTDDHRSTSSASASDAMANATDASTTTATTTTATTAPSPRWQDFAIQSRNFAFTCKIETGFHFRFSHLFATWEERTATRMVLSALHGYWEIISWEHALIPMAYDALRRCNMDEQAAFEYLLANKQLYEHLFTEEWCWKPGCVGCPLPRNKFEYYGDELKAQGFVLYSY
ncbi:hypothetical protein FI667_g11307, partial [Globisporangium splendens]